MEVNDLVKKAIDEKNRSEVENTEGRVKTLVNCILHTQSQINSLLEKIAECKKELKELQMPKPHTLEL